MAIFAMGAKTLGNLGTGLKLGTMGKTMVNTYGVGGLGAEVARGSRGANSSQLKQEVPGIHAPIRMSYDGRHTPTMGADGELTLALSKLNS